MNLEHLPPADFQPVSTEQVTLLRGDDTSRADLLYLAEHTESGRNAGVLRFLHYVRSPAGKITGAGNPTGTVAALYYRALPKAMSEFQQLVSGRSCDLIIAPPSRRHDAEPYVAAARCAYPDIPDATPCLVRMNWTVSAGTGCSVEALSAELGFTAVTPRLERFGHVLIVDDVFASGVTAGAVLIRLREQGLRREARVTVAAPLRVRASSQAKAVKNASIDDIIAAMTPDTAAPDNTGEPNLD